MEENQKNNYLLGIVGAVLGAFIGTIPWILIYVFANMMIAIVSVLIAICSYFGYKFTKAKIDKKLPIIVGAASLFAITVSTFVIIPLCIFAQEGISVTLANFKIIYTYSGFIRDFIITIVFTIVGTSGVIATINRQIKDGVDPDEIKITNPNNQFQVVSPEELENVESIFERSNAFDKDNTISKEEFLQELMTSETELRSKQIFALLRNQGIIRKSGGKYYFCEKMAIDPTRQSKKIALIAIIVTFTVIAVMIVLVASTGSGSKSKNKTNTTNNVIVSNYAGTNVEEYEKEHVISDINIKYVPPTDMIILTKSEINQYMGEGYSDLYDVISMNETGKKLVYVFKVEGEEIKDYTSEEYLTKSLTNSEHGDVTKESIAGLEFAKVEMVKDDSETGEKYIENCYVYKYDNKFLCIDYWRLSTDANEIATMFQKIQ